MDGINVDTLSIEEKVVLREVFSTDDPEAMTMVTAVLSLTDEDHDDAPDDSDEDDWSDDEYAVIKAYYENEEEDNVLDLPDQPTLADLEPSDPSSSSASDDDNDSDYQDGREQLRRRRLDYFDRVDDKGKGVRRSSRQPRKRAKKTSATVTSV